MIKLSCRTLRRHFGALRAVDGVDLELHEGARHALIGPNGAGKSTLFRLITGGLAPTSGRIVLDGRDITRSTETRRAELGIGQTFQHSSLFHTMTVGDNVRLATQRVFGRAWWPLPHHSREVNARGAELLAAVGLSGRDAARVAWLSHGERRQLELAMALAGAPRLLLLDEPAAGLSQSETARLIELIRSLPPELTLLFVEHDLDLVFGLATHVTVMHLGFVLLSGTPDEVRSNPDVRAAYLGTQGREPLFTTSEAP